MPFTGNARTETNVLMRTTYSKCGTIKAYTKLNIVHLKTVKRLSLFLQLYSYPAYLFLFLDYDKKKRDDGCPWIYHRKEHIWPYFHSDKDKRVTDAE